MTTAQYVIARYSPVPSTDESINVGVLMHSPERNYFNFRFLENFSKIRSLYGARDARALENYLADFLIPSLSQMQRHGVEQGLLATLSTHFSGNLQFAPPRATITQDLEGELNTLFDSFVAWRAARHRDARVITDSMLRARVRRELGEYFERRVLQPGPDVGIWASPDFRIRRPARDGMVYVQSLAKGRGDEIKLYAEQLAGNIFLTRKRLQPDAPEFFAIIQPPARADQMAHYQDCLAIIRESETNPYEFQNLGGFRREVLDRAA
ncbi:MAG TPA: DUF3037 domain-containing protein [Candidatus Sulfotelmatobacter sp.]|nr:DUF3037 domain-containing protein [Candidatus Sulfotelmatobacter sp.]